MIGSGLYVLDGHTPVLCPDVETWGTWFEDANNRRVASEQIGDVLVSTVFLALDHNYFGNGPPLLFETMVFGGKLDRECARYSTWEEAEKGHAAMCARVRQATLRLVPPE